MALRHLLSRHFKFGRKPPVEASPVRHYVYRKQLLREDNVVEPLRCGLEAFAAMLKAIAAARNYVHLETYTITDDAVGRQFQQALIERAKAGVTVRLLYDWIGSYELPEQFADTLRAGGVHVAEFHPIAPWRPRRGFNQRDHMKILVVDGEWGFTGGINIAASYAPLESGGGGWFDMHARMRGQVVRDLDSLFARTWRTATGERLTPDVQAHASPRGPHMLAAIIDNFGLRNRSNKRIAYLRAIRAARTSICLMNAYFIPDFLLRHALGSAVRRGVRVHVIVPEVNDVPVVQYASRHLYPRLLRAGVRIHEWPARMMHAKTGVIDGAWSTIGSYNIDRRSMFHNLEASVVVADLEFGKRMQLIFDAELTKSREVVLSECLDRPLLVKLRQWFFYLWRYWL